MLIYQLIITIPKCVVMLQVYFMSMVGWVVDPQECSCPNSWSPWMSPCLAEETWCIWSWDVEIVLGCPGGPSVMTKALVRAKQEESVWEEMRLWKQDTGETSERAASPGGNEKDEEMDSPLESPTGMQPHPTSTPWGTFVPFGATRIMRICSSSDRRLIQWEMANH